jgi:hypothetical protein
VKILMLCVLVCGCASTVPYVTVRPVEAYNRNDFFNDGPEVVITVHNPTNKSITAVLHCGRDLYTPTFPVSILAHKEWSAFGQVMAKDLHAEPCRLEDIQ